MNFLQIWGGIHVTLTLRKHLPQLLINQFDKACLLAYHKEQVTKDIGEILVQFYKKQKFTNKTYSNFSNLPIQQ